MQNVSTIRLILRRASQKNIRGVASTPLPGRGLKATMYAKSIMCVRCDQKDEHIKANKSPCIAAIRKAVRSAAPISAERPDQTASALAYLCITGMNCGLRW